jgi:hypothetical protein
MALGSPEPGEWVFQSFGQANQALLRFEVARSDWFTHVLEPIGAVEYVSTEILLPTGDASLRAAVGKIREAESAYAMHDDPAVFLYCRGAIDVLPGAKQDIFAALSDPDEATLLNSLCRSASTCIVGGTSPPAATGVPSSLSTIPTLAPR